MAESDHPNTDTPELRPLSKNEKRARLIVITTPIVVVALVGLLCEESGFLDKIFRDARCLLPMLAVCTLGLGFEAAKAIKRGVGNVARRIQKSKK